MEFQEIMSTKHWWLASQGSLARFWDRWLTIREGSKQRYLSSSMSWKRERFNHSWKKRCSNPDAGGGELALSFKNENRALLHHMNTNGRTLASSQMEISIESEAMWWLLAGIAEILPCSSCLPKFSVIFQEIEGAYMAKIRTFIQLSFKWYILWVQSTPRCKARSYMLYPFFVHSVKVKCGIICTPDYWGTIFGTQINLYGTIFNTFSPYFYASTSCSCK